MRAALEPRYEVEELVGSGGMAIVFRGTDRSLERPVAIKVLRPELASAVGAERFVREAKRLASLSHPHLASVHEAGEAGGLYYYVMDLIEAETLDRLLERGPLSPRLAVEIAKGLLEALEVVHASGLVHRDVKPQNIFLQGEHPLLADFGIAKSLGEATESFTRTGGSVGTPAYMSPEQAQGRSVGPASDLYAAGLILFQCITGRQWPLGAGGSDVEWSGVPRELRPVLLRALEPIPERRWADAATFRSALAALELAPSVAAWRRPAYAAGTLAVVAGLLVWSPGSADDAAPGIRSVAVGPSAAERPEDAALAVGVSQALYRALLGLDLAVKDDSRREPGGDPRAVGDSLGVEAMAGCSVGAAGRRVRGRAWLTAVPSGDVVWEWPFDVELREIDGDLARRVAAEFGRPVEGSIAAPGHEAMQAYYRGLLAWSRRTEDPDQLTEACRHYEEALRAAPSFDLATAGMAECYAALSGRGLRPAALAFDSSIVFADRAIRLNSRLAAPYAVRGEAIRAYYWEEWADADIAFRQAAERDPNYGRGRLWWALWLAASGRTAEAVRQARLAFESAPRDVDLAVGLGQILYLDGAADSAVARLEETLAGSPLSWEGQLWLVAALIEADRVADARARLDAVDDRLRAGAGAAYEVAKPAMAALFAALGDAATAREYQDRSGRFPVWSAVTHAALGEHEAAIAQLRNAAVQRTEFLTFVGVFPLLDSLRADPRFAELRDELRLPWLTAP